MAKYKGKTSATNANVYTLEMYTIIEYLSSNGCYRGRPAYDTVDGIDRLLYSINSYAGAGYYYDSYYTHARPPKHLKHGTQHIKLYEPQTVVLAAVPVGDPKSSLNPEIGIIIGDISIPAFAKMDKKPIPTVEPLRLHTLDISTMYQTVNDTNQTRTPYYYKGRLPVSSVPGDYVIAGERTGLSMDNYAITVQAGDVRFHYSALTGELHEQAFLKTAKTALTSKESFIIGTKAVQIDQQAYNIYDAYFDCYDVMDEYTLTRNSQPERYRYATYTGDAVNGSYYTFYSHAPASGEPLPLYQTYLDNKGTYTIKTATGLHIGKDVEFTSLHWGGDHIQTDEFLDTIALPQVNVEAAKVLPKVTEEEAYSPNTESTETVTVDRENNAVSLLKGKSGIDFLEDGSIKLMDAWGSYILLSEGNVQIHSANNTFLVSGRDCINIAGGTQVIKAVQDVHLDATEGSILTNAGSDLKLNATNISVGAKEVIGIQGMSTLIKSTDIKLACEAGEKGTLQLGGDGCNVTISSQELVLWGNKSSTLATPSCCLSASGVLKACGNLYVGGGLTLGVCDASITVGDKEHNINTTAGHLLITDGSILVKGMVRSTGAIVATNIIAESVAAKNSNDGKMFKTNNVPIKPTENMLRKQESSDKVTLSTDVKGWDNDTWDRLLFTFDKTSKACNYVVKGDYELEGEKLNRATLNIKGEESYVYPGEPFWKSSGLRVITVDEDGNEKETLQGFSAYGFNKHNTKAKGN